MGKILSGILSPVSGKISGVVGGTWKDVAYLRGYVKPANPNTAAQQTQRTKFSDAVEFAKPLVGQIFNQYTDKFIKSMSGFNFFIKRNIDEFDGSPVWANLKITEGPLSPALMATAIYDDPDVDITWTANKGNNGADDDKCFFLVYDKSSGLFRFASGETNRSIQADMLSFGAGLTATDLQVYLLTAQYVDNVLTIISNSSHMQCSTP